MVLDNARVDNLLRDELFNAAWEDGRDFCQLERDEVEPIFDEAFENMLRIFADARALGLNALGVERTGHLAECLERVAVLPGTPVYQ